MNLPKAKEILEVEKKTSERQVDPDFHDALTIALVCMSLVEGILKKWKWLIGQGPFEDPKG